MAPSSASLLGMHMRYPTQPGVHGRIRSIQQPRCIAEPAVQQRVLQLALTEQSLALHGRTIKLVAPEDIDAVMDMYIQAGQNDRDPYWCRPWPSGIALAEQILRRTHLVAGRQVCDLGAGLGIAGIAAALAGAQSVVLLDREPLALQCALESARASGVSAAAAVGGAHPSQVEAMQDYIAKTHAINNSQSFLPPLPSTPPPRLRQAPPPQVAPSASHPMYTSPYPASLSGHTTLSPLPAAGPPARPPTVTAQVFDWAEPQVGHRVDVILACDVLYEGTAVMPIARLVPKLLKPGGYLMLADPPSRTPLNRRMFIEELQKRVAAVSVEEESLHSCALEDAGAEMLSGAFVGSSIPVQFMIFRCSW